MIYVRRNEIEKRKRKTGIESGNGDEYSFRLFFSSFFSRHLYSAFSPFGQMFMLCDPHSLLSSFIQRCDAILLNDQKQQQQRMTLKKRRNDR